MKLIKKISTLVIVAVFGLTVLSSLNVKKVNAAELSETLTCNAGTVSNNTMTFSTENFTFVHAKGSGSSFASYSPWRVYAKNTVTITGGATVGKILKIEITHSGTYYGTISSTSGTVTMATSSGGKSTIDCSSANVTEVVLTNTASSQARWSSIKVSYEENAAATPMDSFAGLETKATLAFTYSSEVSDEVQSGSIDFAPTSGVGAMNGSTNKEIDITNNFDVDSSLFKVTANFNSKTNFYIKSGEIRLYHGGGNGTSISIEVLNPDYKITSFSIDSADSTSLTTTFSDSLATVKNTNSSTSGNVKLYSLSITYESSSSTVYEVSNMKLRLGTAELSQELYDELVALGATFGVEVTNSSDVTKTQAITPVLEGDNYQFALVLTNIPTSAWAEELTARCYVEVEGEKYYMAEKNVSVLGVAELLYTSAETAAEYKGVLNYIKNYGA